MFNSVTAYCNATVLMLATLLLLLLPQLLLLQTCGARVMSMDQIEGLEPIHENWGDVNLGEELDEGGGTQNVPKRTFLFLYIFDLNDSEKLNACAVLYKDMWCCRCSSVCV
jgi:hypothetical protein